MKRFESTERKYMKKPEVAKALKAAINTWIEKVSHHTYRNSNTAAIVLIMDLLALWERARVQKQSEANCRLLLRRTPKRPREKLAKGRSSTPSLNSTLLECTVQYPSTAGMLMRQRLIRYSISADLTAFFRM